MLAGLTSRRQVKGPLASAAVHGLLVAALLVGWAKAPRVVPAKLPGVADGKHLLLTYSTGGAASAAAVAPKPKAPTAAKTPQAKAVPTAPTVAEAKPMAEQGSGSSGLSAMGSGNMTIASVKVFPRPEPDLSSMPRGHGGNVVLDAVIDSHGVITQLTVVQSLGEAIDQQVLAAVRGWSYNPATRNGQPIVSEQEIVLHYERG